MRILLILLTISLFSCQKTSVSTGTVPITYIVSGTGFTTLTINVDGTNYYPQQDTSITINEDQGAYLYFFVEAGSPTPQNYTLNMTIQKGNTILLTKSTQSSGSGYFIENELYYQLP